MSPKAVRTGKFTAGDVVTVDFPGVVGIKRRPAVVVSTPLYHSQRPDVIIGILTSRVEGAAAETDYVLQNWAAAGLRHPSAFRAFLVTMPQASIRVIGRLSDHDWKEVQARLRSAVAAL